MKIFFNLIIFLVIIDCRYYLLSQINYINEIVHFNMDSTNTQLFNKLSNGFLVNERIQQNWADTTWINSKRYIHSYNSNNNINEILLQNWNGSSWSNSSNDLYSYDSEYRIIVRILNYWDGNNWIRNKIFSYSYDSFSNLVELVDSNYSKSTFSYENNNLVEKNIKAWTGNDWQNSLLYEYEYNSNNNLIIHRAKFWSGSIWVNDWIENFSFNIQNNQTESILAYWNGSDWENDRRKEFLYSLENQLTDIIGQTWQVNQWGNSYRYLYIYDLNGLLSEKIYLVPDFGNQWREISKELYLYDINSNLIEITNQTLTGGSWNNTSKEIISYIPVTSVVEDFDVSNDFYLNNNYPNPFNPNTKISWQSPIAVYQSLKVYDVLGNEVSTLVDEFRNAGSYEVEFDGGKLSSGVYFYQLRVGDYLETKKMLLLK